jgi:hypothetical protein
LSYLLSRRKILASRPDDNHSGKKNKQQKSRGPESRDEKWSHHIDGTENQTGTGHLGGGINRRLFLQVRQFTEAQGIPLSISRNILQYFVNNEIR